jgi:hypothetical protein
MSAQVLIRKSDHFNSLWLFPEGSNAGLGGLLPRWLLLSVGLVKHVAAVGRQVPRGSRFLAAGARVQQDGMPGAQPPPGCAGAVSVSSGSGMAVRVGCGCVVVTAGGGVYVSGGSSGRGSLVVPGVG